MSEEAAITLQDAIYGLFSGKTLAEQRGLSAEQMSELGMVIEHVVKDGNFELALEGCRFLCAHDHNNPDWWLLQGQVARSYKDFQLSVVSFLTGFTTSGDPMFCVEAARTYLADNQIELAKQAVTTGEQIIEAEGGHEQVLQQLENLKSELSKK